MKTLFLLTTMLLMVSADATFAGTITGEYLEARTCDVYTGPCFANAEMGLAGKEAVMAWKIEKGTWKDVSINGLGVALVVKAEGTLGSDGVFVAREVLAKHDETYMPPEVAKAIKDAGQWRK